MTRSISANPERQAQVINSFRPDTNLWPSDEEPLEMGPDGRTSRAATGGGSGREGGESRPGAALDGPLGSARGA